MQILRRTHTLFLLLVACLLLIGCEQTVQERLEEGNSSLNKLQYSKAIGIFTEVLGQDSENQLAKELLIKTHLEAAKNFKNQDQEETLVKFRDHLVRAKEQIGATPQGKNAEILGEIIYLEALDRWESLQYRADRKAFVGLIIKSIGLRKGSDRDEVMDLLEAYFDEGFEKSRKFTNDEAARIRSETAKLEDLKRQVEIYKSKSNAVNEFINKLNTTMQAPVLQALPRDLLSEELRKRMSQTATRYANEYNRLHKRLNQLLVFQRRLEQLKPLQAALALYGRSAEVKANKFLKVSKDRVTVTTLINIPVKEESKAEFLKALNDMTSEQLTALANNKPFLSSKIQIALAVSAIIPQLLTDIEKMRQPLRASIMETYQIDKIDLVAHETIKGQLQPRVVASISNDEIINLAIEYELVHNNLTEARDEAKAGTLDAKNPGTEPTKKDGTSPAPKNKAP